MSASRQSGSVGFSKVLNSVFCSLLYNNYDLAYACAGARYSRTHAIVYLLCEGGSIVLVPRFLPRSQVERQLPLLQMSVYISKRLRGFFNFIMFRR